MLWSNWQIQNVYDSLKVNTLMLGSIYLFRFAVMISWVARFHCTILPCTFLSEYSKILT